MKRTLGTCYYPEHWPRQTWQDDARRMAEIGLTWVRIGEFAWSRLEPSHGSFDWEWLDSAISVLGAAGLKIVLGTPTATPPRWMLTRHPDMLAVDAEGRTRKFGSRRHYCFSHQGYQNECDRIVEVLAQRYGHNPHVAAWQTDNEFGCHSTTISYSAAAAGAFREWLRLEYPGVGNDGAIADLNRAWGNEFWSMDYANFDEIDLPNLTVTAPNPAHQIAFRRFSSDQVVRFNKRQADIIRKYSDAPITHNFMGRAVDFDHFKVGDDLDFASWDSYPLGFLEDRIDASDDHKIAFVRQGDPDFQAFHHDLYRAVGRGRWWVMEQQPGPVNWAAYNPIPLPGMVRLWTWEAFAHGAEAVCYFRWRQVPFAQEQMHAGMLRRDDQEAPAMAEARQVAREIGAAPDVDVTRSPVALVFDYDAAQGWDIQPHGRHLDYFSLVFGAYKAMRALGLSVDILPASTGNFAGYRLILVPGLLHMPDDLKSALSDCEGLALIGPRSGARTHDMQIPVPLPPAFQQLNVTVVRVESLRPGVSIRLEKGGAIEGYFEILETDAPVLEATPSGEPVLVGDMSLAYLGGWPDATALTRILQQSCAALGVVTTPMPTGVRVREAGSDRFIFNYNAHAAVLGDLDLAPLSVMRQSPRL